LCWAEPGQDLGGCRGGTLVFEHVVYVAADEESAVDRRVGTPVAAQIARSVAGIKSGPEGGREVGG
jgi:hypothetical protein